MNEATGYAVNVTEQAVKAMEAAYDVICLEQTTTQPPKTQPPTTQPPTTQPPTRQTTEQTTQAPEPTTGSGEQDRINKRT